LMTELSIIERQLRIAMFCAGARDLSQLTKSLLTVAQ